jgi:sugar phosphate isomerase/epimerase
MKLGFLSAILGELSFEEVIAFAKENGFSCVELACWPKGKAERRYAGVSHIDADNLNDAEIERIRRVTAGSGVEISALGYYPNPLDSDPDKRNFYIGHLKKLINAAQKLGVANVNTFIGKDKNKTVDENFELFKKVWPDIIKYAEEKQVRVCIENCPMYFTYDEWPGGCNLATTPAIWRRMFSEIPSPNFGLNFDPSHFVWQQMDYIKPIYDFKDKLFHIHFKDVKLYADKLSQIGTMATPLEYFSPKLPGLGDVNWGKFVSALTDIDYDGYACIEVEDKAFEGSLDDRKKSIVLSKRYMSQFVI